MKNMKKVAQASSLQVETPTTWKVVLPAEHANQYCFASRDGLNGRDGSYGPVFAVPVYGAASKMAMGTLPLPGEKTTLESKIFLSINTARGVPTFTLYLLPFTFC